MVIPSSSDRADSRSGWVAGGLLAGLRWYRDAVSPALPPRCRFYPTCSSYAITAVHRYGPVRGLWLALRRIVRCAPWHPGGVDHVPPADRDRDPMTQSESPPSSRKDVGPQRRSASQETAVV